ncbi:methyltransferase domain-containing protein [Candidatus Woesearchaeota archaeon]|nr:methyltransferase domain-containing protein [Candidatus Woesearchaeota archaeon]
MKGIYTKFSAKGYLQEYFMENEYDYDDESKFLLQFFHDTYSMMGPRKRLLEVGGGPIIYSIISASSAVDEIFFSDYLEENLGEVRKWLQKKDDAFNWDKYFELVLRLEKKEVTLAALESCKERLRRKVKKLVRCDILNSNPIGDSGKFDVVASNFCVEGVVSTADDFRQSLGNIVSLLGKDGLLVMTLLKNGTSYKVRDQLFSVFPVNEAFIEAQVKALGFFKIKIRSIDIEDKDRGYSGFIGLTAKKKN